MRATLGGLVISAALIGGCNADYGYSGNTTGSRDAANVSGQSGRTSNQGDPSVPNAGDTSNGGPMRTGTGIGGTNTGGTGANGNGGGGNGMNGAGTSTGDNGSTGSGSVGTGGGAGGSNGGGAGGR